MIGLIVQARMGSSRLPGKVMMQIDGKNPLLYYAIKQNKVSKYGKNLVIATTTKSEDDIIEEYAKKNNIMIFRGSSENVLDRYYQCAKNISSSVIVRVTADCPLIDPEIVDKVITKFIKNKFDYVSNTHPRTFPYGTETEVFSFNALEKAWNETRNDFDREHVTPYFYKNPNKFSIGNVIQEKDQSNYRWTIDYNEDLELVKYIANNIIKKPILTNDIINLIIKNPNLLKINESHN